MNQTISLKESIERRLSEQSERDPGLLARLQADPDSVIKPLIAEALGDDGGLDLTTITTTVHVETADNLHFVLTLPGADAPSDDVEGFALGAIDIAGSLRTGAIDIGGLGGDALFGRKTSTGKKCCTVDESMCKTVNWTCNFDNCPHV